MPFDFDINHYAHNDLKKLFNVKDDETISDDEIDVRLANIKFTAGINTKDQNELRKIYNFLEIAKEKYITFQNSKLEYNNVYPMTEKLESVFVKNKFLDNNEHAIIEHTKKIRIPTETKLFNINSIDRDLVALPYESNFEIELPQDIRDVTNIGLHDYNLYFSLQTFSNFYQNTKLRFTCIKDSVDHPYTIVLPDGTYSNVQLCDKIIALMNIASKGLYGDNDDNFTYFLSDTTGKLTIISTKDTTFMLHFEIAESFEQNKWQIRNIYDLRDSWGLGYFMGYNKQKYTSSTIAKIDLGIVNENLGDDIVCVTANNLLRTNVDSVVFLEIDGFNYAYQTSTNTGKVNSYFAKIPILTGYTNDSGGLEYRVVSAERISKLKLKLRFHNGILLDTNGQNFDFTLSFNCKK